MVTPENCFHIQLLREECFSVLRLNPFFFLPVLVSFFVLAHQTFRVLSLMSSGSRFLITDVLDLNFHPPGDSATSFVSPYVNILF